MTIDYKWHTTALDRDNGWRFTTNRLENGWEYTFRLKMRWIYIDTPTEQFPVGWYYETLYEGDPFVRRFGPVPTEEMEALERHYRQSAEDAFENLRRFIRKPGGY